MWVVRVLKPDDEYQKINNVISYYEENVEHAFDGCNCIFLPVLHVNVVFLRWRSGNCVQGATAKP